MGCNKVKLGRICLFFWQRWKTNAKMCPHTIPSNTKPRVYNYWDIKMLINILMIREDILTLASCSHHMMLAGTWANVGVIKRQQLSPAKPSRVELLNWRSACSGMWTLISLFYTNSAVIIWFIECSQQPTTRVAEQPLCTGRFVLNNKHQQRLVIICRG